MLHVVEHGHVRKRVYGRHSVACCVAEQYTVFDVDTEQSAGLQYPHQFGSEIVHLLKELLVILIMPEVVVCRRVLVVVGERYAGHNKTDRVFRHVLTLQHIVVVYRSPHLARLFLTLGEHVAHHLFLSLQTEQTVFPYDVRHVLDHVVMLRPLLHE